MTEGRTHYDEMLDKQEKEALLEVFEAAKSYIGEWDNPAPVQRLRGRCRSVLREAIKNLEALELEQ